MNQPGIDIPFYTEEQCIELGYEKASEVISSTETGISYRFFVYINNRSENNKIYRMAYIRDITGANRYQIYYFNRIDDAMTYLNENRILFEVFPPAERYDFPGLPRASHTTLFMLIGEECYKCFKSIENGVKEYNSNITIVLKDKLDINGDIYERPGLTVPRFITWEKGVNNQKFQKRISLRSKNGRSITHDVLIENGLLGYKEIQLTQNVRLALYGSMYILDFIEAIIEPYVGFQPIKGFHQVEESYTVGAITEYPVEELDLTSEMKSRLNEHLTALHCGKNKTKTRIESLMRKVQNILQTKGVMDKYLNLSTCQEVKSGKGLVTYVGGTIPGSNTTLKFAIKTEDLAFIITGNTKLSPENMAYSNAIFKYTENAILKPKDTTSKPETNPIRVSYDVLDRIPKGVSADVKKFAKKSMPFPVSNVSPMEGVISVGLPPITDSNRCLPSLGVKKIAIIPIDQEHIMALDNVRNILNDIQSSYPKVSKFEIVRQNVLADITNDVEEVISTEITPALEAGKLTRSERPITFDVASLSRKIEKADVQNLNIIQVAETENSEDDENDSFDSEDYQGDY